MKKTGLSILSAIWTAIALGSLCLPAPGQDAPPVTQIADEIEKLTGERPPEAPLAAPPAATPAALPETTPAPVVEPSTPAVSPEMPAPTLPLDTPPPPAADETSTDRADVIRLDEEGQLPFEVTERSDAAGAQLISVSLDNVPLEDVVRMFTRVSGANIIATSTNLEGFVTVNLVDVEWHPALSSILSMHKLSLVEKIPGSGVYSIQPKQADAPEPLIVETIFLAYTTVKDVEPVIKSMLMTGGTVSPFASRNAVVVRTTSANLGEIRQILKLVDIPGQQVCIETKFMELSDEASRQLGIRWDSLEEFGVRAGLGPFSRTEDTTRTQSKIDSQSEWDKRSKTDVVKKYYDVNGEQYEVIEEIEAVEVDEDDTRILETISPTTEFSDSIDTGKDVTSDITDSFTKTIKESRSAILEMDSLDIVLSALKKTDGVSVISNPKLIVANGEEGAFFSVGQREPIIKTETTRGTTDSPGDKTVAELDTNITTDYIRQGYLETGIDLKVVPVIKSDGLIEAMIAPSLRSKVGDKFVGENSWPIISVKEIQTRFTLRDRQTVAIGGLTNTKDEKRTSKIPLLGDIPLVGKYLFSHTKDVKSQIETIIFVTLSLAAPETLEPQQGIPEQAELVHRRLLQNRVRRRDFEKELSKMQQAMELEELPPTQQPPPPPPAPPQPPEASAAPVTVTEPPPVAVVEPTAAAIEPPAASELPAQP